jgi:hypothetical protein
LNPFPHFIIQNTSNLDVTNYPIVVKEDGVVALTSVIPFIKANSSFEYLLFPFGGIQPHDSPGLHSMTLDMDPNHTYVTINPTTKWNDFVCYYHTPASSTSFDFTGANATKPNVCWTGQGFHLHGQFQDKSYVVHYNVTNNSNVPTAGGTITLTRNGVTPVLGTGAGDLMNLGRSGPMDITYPALSPGEDGPQTYGVYIENNNTTGVQVTWNATIVPGETDAYSNDKSKECIVVNGLISTGFEPSSPFYTTPIQ